MTRRQVLDTTILIGAIRDPLNWRRFQRAMASGQVWLPSVVAAELYAGTRSAPEALLIGRLVAAMQRVERLLVPTGDDWLRAGRLLARRIRLHGDLRPRDHLADVLILVSAARVEGQVVTLNLRHFEPWAKLARASGLDVVVTGPPPA